MVSLNTSGLKRYSRSFLLYLLKVEILMGLALTSDEREGWAAWVEQGVKGRNSSEKQSTANRNV